MVGNTLNWRSLWSLCWAVLILPGALFAQEITVSNAVISISGSAVISTDGGITLQNAGSVANQGIIELKGDWINDGAGLLPESQGTVVLNGEDQRIGGENPTRFHHLKLEGSGTKELLADIEVSGNFTAIQCQLLTGEHAFVLNQVSRFDLAWANAQSLQDINSPQKKLTWRNGSFPFSGNGSDLLSFAGVSAGTQETISSISAPGSYTTRTEMARCNLATNNPGSAFQESRSQLRGILQSIYHHGNHEEINFNFASEGTAIQLNPETLVQYSTIQVDTPLQTRQLEIISVTASSFLASPLLGNKSA